MNSKFVMPHEEKRILYLLDNPQTDGSPYNVVNGLGRSTFELFFFCQPQKMVRPQDIR
jgi:hypothetical protein